MQKASILRWDLVAIFGQSDSKHRQRDNKTKVFPLDFFDEFFSDPPKKIRKFGRFLIKHALGRSNFRE